MKIQKVLSLFFAILLLAIVAVHAASIDPSRPTSVTTLSNTTVSYPNGTIVNYTRGYIYTLQINESAQTQKWVGYVGNVYGEYALQDASANALYDWDIATVTGEIYATKEGPLVSGTIYELNDGGGTVNPYAGGIPQWSSLDCANSTMISREELLWNHTTSEEDSYTNTFKNGANFNLPTGGFYAGETLIDDTAYGSGDCYGLNLNINNADVAATTARNWTETILTDATYQPLSSNSNTVYVYDLLYAGLLQNNSVGFDGGSYDFQLLLPQTGLSGNQPNVAYYFYIELI